MICQGAIADRGRSSCRGRDPYNKNDNRLEQCNWTYVRKEVGHRGSIRRGELAALSALYAALRLYKNLVQPALKLKG